MEKSSNSSKIVGDAFRGPSGYETVDEQPLPETRGRVLGLGLLAAAVILCAVVFVAVPSPSSGAGANTHGLAMRCVDNSARVVPRPRTENAFRPRRPRRRRCLTSNLVGDCCPSSSGKNLACCRDGTNIATVTRTAKGACDDNSACAALCGNQIFNPTSMCAYATVSTQSLRPCFEKSTRAIDSSKNQPNRLRFDRAREF